MACSLLAVLDRPEYIGSQPDPACRHLDPPRASSAAPSLCRAHRRNAQARPPPRRAAGLPGDARGHRAGQAHRLPRDVHPALRSHRDGLRRRADRARARRGRGQPALRRLGIIGLERDARPPPPRRRAHAGVPPAALLGQAARDHRPAHPPRSQEDADRRQRRRLHRGLNIADDYAPAEDGGAEFRDTHIRLEGPAAAELEYFFLQTWRAAAAPRSTPGTTAATAAGPILSCRSSPATSAGGGTRSAWSTSAPSAARASAS